jgi:hypothetical protein
MKKITQFSVLIVLVALMFTSVAPIAQAINNTTSMSQYDPTGTWDYEAQTPDGTVKDVMTIVLNDEGVYEVTIKSQIYGTLELDDVLLDKLVLTGNVDIEGTSIDFEMTFDGDNIEGIINTGEAELTFTAKRQK